MTLKPAMTGGRAIEEAVAHLREAVKAKKCWSCGCLDNGIADIERALSDGIWSDDLHAVMRSARERLVDIDYECLGCETCYPAQAINALSRDGVEQPIDMETRPSAKAEARDRWPPLPGSYTVLRHSAPIAVCTLTDERLAGKLAKQAGPATAIVGTLQTENLGIERLIQNIVANPNIRFLIVCGADSRQDVGHLPGQSLVALARMGVDEHGRIRDAAGKRPILRNLSGDTVEHFRRTVEVVDLLGRENIPTVLETIGRCADRHPGPAKPFAHQPAIVPVQGQLPRRMIADPTGYFVIYVDRSRQLLSLEHYQTDGALDVVIEGRTAPELYMTVIDRGIISRLDHAAYLGHELARAEQALASGETFVQDAAPENSPDSHAGTACQPGSGATHGRPTDCDT